MDSLFLKKFKNKLFLSNFQIHAQREALPFRGSSGGRPTSSGRHADQAQADGSDAVKAELRHEVVAA